MIYLIKTEHRAVPIRDQEELEDYLKRENLDPDDICVIEGKRIKISRRSEVIYHYSFEEPDDSVILSISFANAENARNFKV